MTQLHDTGQQAAAPAAAAAAAARATAFTPFHNPALCRHIASFLPHADDLFRLRGVTRCCQSTIEDAAESDDMGDIWCRVPLQREAHTHVWTMYWPHSLGVFPTKPYPLPRVRGYALQHILTRRGHAVLCAVLTTGRLRWVLHMALRHGMISIRYVTRCFAVNNTKALHTAAAHGQTAVVDLLLSFGADPREHDLADGGSKAVDHALRFDRSDCVLRLLAGLDPLHAAALTDNAERLRRCLLELRTREACVAALGRSVPLDYRGAFSNIIGVVAFMGYAHSMRELCDFLEARGAYAAMPEDEQQQQQGGSSDDSGADRAAATSMSLSSADARRAARSEMRLRSLVHHPLRYVANSSNNGSAGAASVVADSLPTHCPVSKFAEMHGATPLVLAMVDTPTHLEVFNALARVRCVDLSRRSTKRMWTPAHHAVNKNLPQFFRALKEVAAERRAAAAAAEKAPLARSKVFDYGAHREPLPSIHALTMLSQRSLFCADVGKDAASGGAAAAAAAAAVSLADRDVDGLTPADIGSRLGLRWVAEELAR